MSYWTYFKPTNVWHLAPPDSAFFGLVQKQGNGYQAIIYQHGIQQSSTYYRSLMVAKRALEQGSETKES